MKKIDIKHLSKLANIQLDKDEEKKLQEDLDKIIKHIQKIQEVEISCPLSSNYLKIEKLILREDKEEKPLPVKEVLLNTVNPINNHFTINKIINEDNS
ncbi:MAG: aspartyl/glutamyl-tRNA amidotransferase subunit C [candidate division WOR-3 bacterium]